MALSVKRFIHENDCPEPSEQINVMYHPTDPQVLCDGGGTLTALFGEVGNLFELSMGSDDGFAGQGDVCAEGMDVVFVVDYTGSMGDAISGVKTGISNLISTIDTESNSNYRLGLVLFDGGACSYNTSNFYTSLPANQKINDGCDKIITCVEKMSTVGNSTSFTNGLNSIDTADMPTGASIEWGMTAISEVVNNGFAGSFRNGVQKLIILITDDDPEQDAAYATTLKSQLDAEGFQVMYNTSAVSGDSRYNTLLETQPAGDGHYNLDYDSTWTEGLEVSIASLCQSTFVYTCEPPAIGYYMELGDTATWWYTGTGWNGPINCEYDVKVNLHTSLGTQNYEIADIPTDHYAYLDSNTFKFTGYAGLGFDIDLWLLEAANDWSIDEISWVSVQTVSGSLGDFTIYTNPAVTGSTYNPFVESDQAFGFDGTITGDAEYNVYIGAKTSQDVHAFSITVISDEPDGTNADGEAQEPDGTILLDPQTPATSWINVSSLYPTKFQATKYTFSSITGGAHSFHVDFDQNPSDYAFTLNSVGPQYSHPGAQTALQNNWTANSDGITGSFNMPQGGGSAFFYLDAQVNQPEYLFTLQLSENIAGAGIVGGNFSQSSYYGYTGDTLPWISNLYKVGNYDSFTITNGNMSNGVSLTTGSGSGIGEVITTNTNIGGNITMPAGGGSGSGVFSGTSVESQYDFDLSITDDFFIGDYGADFTVTGTVGQIITRTKALQGTSADITYAISKITSSNSNVTVTANGTTLTIKVTMPSGGGSADIAVEGSETSNNYQYTVTWDANDSTNGELYGWANGPGKTRTTTVTGIAGQTFSLNPSAPLVTIQDYFSQDSGRGATPRVTIQPGAAELTNATYTTVTQTSGTNSITEGINPEVILTMPSGGGSATVGTLLVPAQIYHSFAVSFSTDTSASGVIAHTCSGGADLAGVSRSSISGGSQVISFGGYTNTTWTGVQVPIAPNDNTNYDNEINSITAANNFFNLSGVSATEASNYCGADREFVLFNFKMPSLDPRHGINYNARSVVIDDFLIARTLSFTLTSVHNMSNANITYADITQTFTGAVGSQHNYTSRYYATEGYTLALTGVSDNSSAVTSSVSGNNVTGVITMPSGGGSGQITASGNTTLNEFTHTVTIVENVANAQLLQHSGGKRVISFTGAPGATKRFTGEALSIQSGYYYTSGPTVTGNSSLTSRSISASGAMDITITIGSANTSSSLSVTGSTALITRTLTIRYYDNSSGAIIASGSGSGYTTYSADYVTGAPGSTGRFERFFMPASGYISANISSVSDNSSATNPFAGSTAGAGQRFFVDYTIPSVNTISDVTVNAGSVVPATAATAATTLATAATTQRTKATIATTQATEATTLATRPTIATTQATLSPWVYYTVTDCNGTSWYAKASYYSPRFTYHEVGLAPAGFVGSTALITRQHEINPGGDLVFLQRTSTNECEPGGGGGDSGPRDPWLE